MKLSGTLVIADISGYTAFLSGSELDHAQGILDGLIDCLIKELDPPFSVANLEGDAVFCHAPAGSIMEPQSLIDAIEMTYVGFADTREQMHRNTTCTCTACSLIPTLDLKFVAHHGDYVMSTHGGRNELTGTDVIVAHRLLKNSIPETAGTPAYAFLTTATPVASTGAVQSMRPHSEEYEHLGTVNGYVHDLAPVLERVRSQRHIAVSPEEAWFVVQDELPIPPNLAWDYSTEPAHRQILLGADGFSEQGSSGGRRGIGTEQHCAHGEDIRVHTIVDWHPFDYVTFQIAIPQGGTQRYTVEFTPTELGTRVTCYMGKGIGRNRLGTAILRAVMGLRKSGFRRNIEAGMALIAQEIETDLAAGRIQAEMEAPAEEPA